MIYPGMKRLPVCLLACFLICGVVSAAALIPAAQRTVISVAPSPLPTVRMTVGQAAAAPALNTLNARGTVELGSVPSGADVTIDGADAPSAKTPVKLSLLTGIHTLLLSFPGYTDRAVTVTVAAGSVESVTVTLVPVVARGLDRTGGTLAAIPPVVAAVPRTMVSCTTAVHTPVLLRNISSPATPTPLSCPSSDWTCMPLSQAGAQFGFPYARYGSTPCGYRQNGSQTVAEYCCMAVPGGTVSPGALAASGIRATDPDLHIVNRTAVAPVPDLSLIKKPLGAIVQPRQDFISSFLGFFTGFFSAPVSCPAGMTNCGGGCADMATDVENCGFCGMTCFDPAVCCGGECVDLLADEMNCGFCGMTCFDPAVCCYGSCEDSCDYVVGVVETQPTVVGAVGTQPSIVGLAETQPTVIGVVGTPP
jgi:hypothetical protein